MPYRSKANLPDAVKSLSDHLQEIWMAAFNSAWKDHSGDEETCFKIAWSAVNKARGSAKASLHYFPRIEAKAVDGKRFILVELMDERVSRPLSEPYGYRWKVDDESINASVDSLKSTVLCGPVAGLEHGHELKRPVARFVDYEKNGCLRAKYELIEDDSAWASYAWAQIQAGNWRYVSAFADFDWNYPVDVREDIVYPHRFKLKTVDFVPYGAFPSAQVYHTFSEGLAAMLASEFSQAHPKGFDQKQKEKKKMSEEQLVELQTKYTKDMEDVKAKLDKAEKATADALKQLELERERNKILDKKTETVDARTLEALKGELDKSQKRIAELEKIEADKKDKEKTTLATEVADLYVQTGMIMPKDAVPEAERLKTFEEPALLELKAKMADVAILHRCSPKVLPSTGSLKATVDPKERRRMERYGEYVDDEGKVVQV